MVELSSEWLNPCGGVRWRTLPNGLIEVEGQGFPEYAPGSNQYRYIEQTWNNWAPQFQAAAKKFNVPLVWILALAAIETGFVSSNPEKQRTIESGDGFHSIGIMQPLPSTAITLGYTTADRYDAGKNIEMGAKLISQLDPRYGLPAVGARYNSGKLCSAGNDQFNLKGYKGAYVTQAIKYNNTALHYLKLSSSNLLLTALMGAGVAGLIVAGFVYWKRW